MERPAFLLTTQLWHAIAECWALHRLFHRRIKEGTLELTQPEVQRNPLPNHKEKGVVLVVIFADLGDEEEERPSLPMGAIMTFQKSSQFKNLFDQLEFTANERRMATEALVSIAQEAGVKCLIAKTRSNQDFLEDTNEITFCDEDMEERYLSHRRPLYLAASINQIPIKRALVDTGSSVNLIPLSMLQVARIPESKILGYPMKVIGIGGKGEYTTGLQTPHFVPLMTQVSVPQ